ncbi:amidohydrolase family protein [Herbaspirillum autotrophicum]|uniref:amidohydrolase family protein n=1 Tax=Herbaspirillum autotrophicum TaxID=180195 RepID=UPI00067ADB09|nr:amidohydrolase family protein [Herbaspirillum autotrophicum]
MIKLTKTMAAVWVSAALTGCATADMQTVTQGTLIRNVTVVNTRDGSLSPDMAVILASGKIERIVPAAGVRAGAGAKEVDGSGKYLVPGFLDMHTHAMLEADQKPAPWPLLLAHGVTGVREMAGSPALIEQSRRLNADSVAGRIDAPEILLIPGTLLVGVGTADQGVQQVRQQKAMGADFVKLVSASRDGALAVLAEAKAQGLTVAGHLPVALGAAQAANAGWHSVEHLGSGLGILLDCAAQGDEARAALLRGEGAPPVFTPSFIATPMLYRERDAQFYQRVIDSYSDTKCRALAQVFVRNGTWHVPTLIRLRTSEFSNDVQYRKDPHLAWINKGTRAKWEQLATQYDAKIPASAQATFRHYYGLQQQVVKLLKDSGVKMLAGSDFGGIWVIPGYSLHQEFRELAAAGLTPLEILQMTTLNGATFLGKEASMGTVEAGKNADLVLLDANPIADASNLDQIAGVFLRGRYFSATDLDRMKRDVAQAWGNQPLATGDKHGHVH